MSQDRTHGESGGQSQGQSGGQPGGQAQSQSQAQSSQRLRAQGNPDEIAQNPRDREPKPPFPHQVQAWPGLESKMQPLPDYGETSYKGYGRLAGKAALITGGDSGIGRAVALAYAREGADVLIAYYDEHSDAEETVRAVEAAGRRGVAVAGDIGEEAHCQHLVARTLHEFGRLDILVNNAAYQHNRPSLVETPSDEIERTFKTNILAMFWLAKAAIPHMKPGSVIINTASIQAFKPSPSIMVYASTKGAIVTFTKALAQQTIQQGIRVNAVAPGPVWTPLIVSSGESKPGPINFGKESPIGRAAQPAELAPAYVYLALNEASYVNGEVIGVTGGEPPL